MHINSVIIPVIRTLALLFIVVVLIIDVFDFVISLSLSLATQDGSQSAIQ
jgi:hypothetical protein